MHKYHWAAFNGFRDGYQSISCALALSAFLLSTTGSLIGVSNASLAADSKAQKARSGAAPAAAADPLAPDSPMQIALTLYQLGNYAAAADNFEVVLRTAAPEPRLYYYAALANQNGGRAARAKQLFEFISTHFPTSQEGGLARMALDTSKARATAVVAAVAAAKAKPPVEKPKEHTKGAIAFSSQDIAKWGNNAIDQSQYPNCWFEASISALAQLPRGQKLLSSMIHYGEGDKYVVRFPGDGVEYVVSEEDCMEDGISNRALWASLLECAEIRKFPGNRGADGEDNEKSRLEVGMGCITGAKAEVVIVKELSLPQLKSFIDGAVRSQNPIIGGTFDERTLSAYPEIIVGLHAYTIIGFDPVKNMVILRNPHGANSRRFWLANDPQHLQFEQLDDGKFKINLDLFPNYFYSIARSFI